MSVAHVVGGFALATTLVSVLAWKDRPMTVFGTIACAACAAVLLTT
jgi:hypothetical protein